MVQYWYNWCRNAFILPPTWPLCGCWIPVGPKKRRESLKVSGDGEGSIGSISGCEPCRSSTKIGINWWLDQMIPEPNKNLHWFIWSFWSSWFDCICPHSIPRACILRGIPVLTSLCKVLIFKWNATNSSTITEIILQTLENHLRPDNLIHHFLANRYMFIHVSTHGPVVGFPRINLKSICVRVKCRCWHSSQHVLVYTVNDL